MVVCFYFELNVFFSSCLSTSFAVMSFFHCSKRTLAAVTARIQIWWKRDLVPEEVRSGVDLEGMGLVWFCVSRMKIRDEEIWC